MLTKLNTNILAVGLLLILLITRGSHFGSASLLPDASIACFFMLGALHARLRWILISILLAVAIDLVVTRWLIVSDYCMSPGYWALIPIYGMIWMFGRSVGNKKHVSTWQILSRAWLATSLAFVLSNLAWYAYSDKVAMMSLSDFSLAVAKYYVPYTGFSLFYVLLAYGMLRLASTIKAQSVNA